MTHLMMLKLLWDEGKPYAKEVIESWADAEWFKIKNSSRRD